MSPEPEPLQQQLPPPLMPEAMAPSTGAPGAEVGEVHAPPPKACAELCSTGHAAPAAPRVGDAAPKACAELLSTEQRYVSDLRTMLCA